MFKIGFMFKNLVLKNAFYNSWVSWKKIEKINKNKCQISLKCLVLSIIIGIRIHQISQIKFILPKKALFWNFFYNVKVENRLKLNIKPKRLHKYTWISFLKSFFLKNFFFLIVKIKKNTYSLINSRKLDKITKKTTWTLIFNTSR